MPPARSGGGWRGRGPNGVVGQSRAGSPARVEVRYRRVVRPPTPDKTAAPVRLSAIHVREITPPAGAQRLEWYRLTTAHVRSAAEAEQIVRYYHLRGRVEDLFRVLQTGGQGSSGGGRPSDRWHPAITRLLVTAGRLMRRTLLGRGRADRPAEVRFTETERERLRV